MGYVAVRCPNCGGDLQLDDSMEKGYCTHCGTPIYFKEAIQKIKIIGPVEIIGLAKLDSLIKLIKKNLEFGMNRTPEFRDRLNRALELDPGNKYLYDLQSSEIWNAKIIEGKLVEYRSNAKRIVIPDCVTSIERMALMTCHYLEHISLPRSIVNIAEHAFYREERLVIAAYKNTYAARYALMSPAFLRILDDDEENQENIRKIEEVLQEVVAYKNMLIKDINRYYNNKLFTIRIFWPFLIVALIASMFFRWPFLLGTPTGKLIIAITGGLSLVLIIFTRGYVAMCRKAARQSQVLKFYKKSNDLLSPLGITDFKYLKNIWESNYLNLAGDLKRLESAKKQILSMDRKQFFRNPYVDLSFFSYIAGKRVKDIDRY